MITELNRNQIGMSWSLPLEDGASALVPAVSVRDWLPCVALALDSEVGRAAVAKHYTSVTAVLECAPVVGSFANLHTGRGITAAQATMAEQTSYSDKTIRKVLYVLRDLGLAKDMKTGRRLSTIEIAAAHAHHGGRQLNAASVWHLTVPRPLAATQTPLTPRRKSASLGRMNRAAHITAAAEIKPETMSPSTSGDAVSGHLSSRTSVLEESSVGKNSPKRARGARGRENSSKEPRKIREDPHPLHRQLTAAELVAELHGMDSGQWVHVGSRQYVRLYGSWHIGAVCDALAEAGIDTEQVGGRAIARGLTELTIERGLTWPNHIRNPIGFLRSLLARLTKSKRLLAKTGHRSIRQHEVRCAEHPHSPHRADGECVGCYGDRMAAKLPPESALAGSGEAAPSARYVRRSTAQPAPETATERAVVTHRIGAVAGEAVDGLCTACCEAPGVLREQLLIPTPVCDSCWSTVDPATLDQDHAPADGGLDDELTAAAGDARARRPTAMLSSSV
ncbi:hypothetical protein ACWEO2_40080 [Nocardia sp. NPDC004278]